MPAEVAIESKALIVNGVVIKGLIPRMSMEEFYAFCALNQELRIERDSADGSISVIKSFDEALSGEEFSFELSMLKS